MDLSAVIVNWNGGGCLARLLDSLEPLRRELREIVVVDNASDDDSRRAVRPGPALRLIALESNRGFAAAANEGIASTSSGFILLLNPDVEVRPPHVRELYRRMLELEDAAIGCVQLRDKYGGSQLPFQVRPLPSWKTVLQDVLFLDEMKHWMGSTPDPLPGLPNGPVEVEQPAAAFWMLRREAWSRIGGFDPDFVPAWFEDVDFCKRLRRAGWKSFLFPDLTAVHQGGLSLRRLGYSSFVRIYYGNLLKYLKKHHPAAHPVLWIPVQVGILLRRLMGRRRGPP